MLNVAGTLPQDKGHPDMKLVETEEEKAWVFAGGIATREQLARLLTTIAWTASAHHASVNFGAWVGQQRRQQ